MKPKPAKKRSPAKPKKEDLTAEYPTRLTELQAELFGQFARAAGTASEAIPSAGKLEEGKVGQEKVIQFKVNGKQFCLGHTDSTFAGANHARGVRHIHLYDDAQQVILGIDGDIEIQQFGVNFRFRTLKVFVPGEWEATFLSMSDDLRAYREEKKEAFRRLRAKNKA